MARRSSSLIVVLAAASAVATRPPRAGSYMYISQNVCTSAMPLHLSPSNSNMAWTTYDVGTTATSAIDVKDKYFCDPGKVPDAPVCGRLLYSTGGTDPAAGLTIGPTTWLQSSARGGDRGSKAGASQRQVDFVRAGR